MPQLNDGAKYGWFTLHMTPGGFKVIPNASDPGGEQYGDKPTSAKFWHHDNPNGDNDKFVRFLDTSATEAMIAAHVSSVERRVKDAVIAALQKAIDELKS